MRAIDYVIVTLWQLDDIADTIRNRGSAGWELVQAIPINTEHQGKTAKVVLVFKGPDEVIGG